MCIRDSGITCIVFASGHTAAVELFLATDQPMDQIKSVTRSGDLPCTMFGENLDSASADTTRSGDLACTMPVRVS